MQKKIFECLRVLSVMALLLCSVTSGWACGYVSSCAHDGGGYNYDYYPNRNWVERLVQQNPNMLLRDLSIIEAHDAGTWKSSSDNYKDQIYCERELFLKGVRAFDLRLDLEMIGKYPYYATYLGLQEYDIEIRLRHGSDSFAGQEFKELYNTLEEEIFGHFPTPEELSKEFLIIEFKMEKSEDKFETAFCYYELIRILKDKYGYRDDLFVEFNPDLTVAEMQGKIMLMSNAAVLCCGRANLDFARDPFEDSHYTSRPRYYKGKKLGFGVDYYEDLKCPITGTKNCFLLPFDYSVFYPIHGKLDVVINKVTNNLNKDADLSKLNAADSAFLDSLNACWLLSHGEYNIDRKDKKEEIRKSLTTWLKRDGKNKIFNYTTLNSYGFHVIGNNYGLYVCSDNNKADDGMEGVNHLAYNLLSNHKGPFGMLSQDFCGTWKVQDYHTWGSALLDLSIGNNFKSMSYVSEIVVANSENLTEIKRILDEAGCEYAIKDPTKEYILDPNGSHTCIGWKTTEQIEGSVSDIILVKNNDTALESVITQNGITYYLATSIGRNESGGSKEYDGCLRDSNNDKWYLYYSKNDQESLSKKGQVLTGLNVSASNPDGYINCKSASGDMVRFMFQGLNVSSSSQISYQKHEHTYSTAWVDKSGHKDVCQICGYSDPTSVAAHLFYYKDCGKDLHERLCSLCGYLESEEKCQFDDYTNGFAECDICQRLYKEQPQAETFMLDGENSEQYYKISNVGQLYWFADQVNNGSYDINAFLTEDIDFTKDLPSDVNWWIPIGAKNDYTGIFEGNGHVIKGLKCDDNVIAGLFGTISEATIRNLGLVDCEFEGTAYAGSFAAYSIGSTLENVFSNATISPLGENPSFGGIIGECATKATNIRNAFYAGNLRSIRPVATWDNEVLDEAAALDRVFSTTKANDADSVNSLSFSQGYLCYVLNFLVDDHNSKNAIQWAKWTQVLGMDSIPTFGTESIHHEREMSNKWGTLVLPYKVKSDKDIQYYIIKSASVSDEEGLITLREMDEVTANTPCIFKRKCESTHLIFPNCGNESYTAVSPVAYYNQIFVQGTYTQQTIGGESDVALNPFYIAQNKFWRADEAATVHPFRAWLSINPNSNASAAPIRTLTLQVEGEETSTILEIDADGNFLEHDGPVYNVLGQRVDGNAKGLLIRKQGKKVMVM